MSRRRIVWGVALLAVAALLLFWQFGGRESDRRLAVENFPRVRAGMSQAEVEELLGGPPGNYGRFAGGETGMTLEGYISPAGAVERVWCDDANRFEIYFDAGGRVAGQHRRSGYWQAPPEVALRWLRRQFRPG